LGRLIFLARMDCATVAFSMSIPPVLLFSGDIITQ